MPPSWLSQYARGPRGQLGTSLLKALGAFSAALSTTRQQTQHIQIPASGTQQSLYTPGTNEALRAAWASTCFTAGIITSARVSKARRKLEHQADALEQRFSEVYPELQELGVPAELVRKVLKQKGCHIMQASTAQQLKGRFEAFYQLTGAQSVEQRQAVNKQLLYRPALLTRQEGSLQNNAAELHIILTHQFGIPSALVSTLIRKHVDVLDVRPQTVADKLAAWAIALDTDVSYVLKKMQYVHLMYMTTADLSDRIKQLQDILQSEGEAVQQLLRKAPFLLTRRPASLKANVDALFECLGPHGWSRQQLGLALVQYYRVSNLSADSIRRQWQLFQQYAAGDPASQEQLQKQCCKNSVLRLFHTPRRNLNLMKYIMHLHQQLQSLGQSPEPLVQRPLVWQLTMGYYFQRLVGSYPGFWEWQKHQEGKSSGRASSVKVFSSPPKC